MKKSIGTWQLVGFAITSFFGTLLHFLYDLTDSTLVAPFSSVNESTFEHMKLLFWPMFIFAVIQSFFFRDTDSFWCIKLRGTLVGLALIPIIFYTYNSAIGKSPDWINIAIFFVSAAIAYIFETKQFKKQETKCAHPKIALAALCALAALFVVFTFITPEIGIFKDPISGMYGIKRNNSIAIKSLI